MTIVGINSLITIPSLSRCEASNSANSMRPVSSSIRFNVFFEPCGLLDVERPDADDDTFDIAYTTLYNRLFRATCIVLEEICGISIFNSNAGGLWVTEE